MKQKRFYRDRDKQDNRSFINNSCLGLGVPRGTIQGVNWITERALNEVFKKYRLRETLSQQNFVLDQSKIGPQQPKDPPPTSNAGSHQPKRSGLSLTSNAGPHQPNVFAPSKIPSILQMVPAPVPQQLPPLMKFDPSNFDRVSLDSAGFLENGVDTGPLFFTNPC